MALLYLLGKYHNILKFGHLKKKINVSTFNLNDTSIVLYIRTLPKYIRVTNKTKDPVHSSFNFQLKNNINYLPDLVENKHSKCCVLHRFVTSR